MNCGLVFDDDLHCDLKYSLVMKIAKSHCPTHGSLSLFWTWKIPYFYRVNNINIYTEGSRFVTYPMSKGILLQFKNHNI